MFFSGTNVENIISIFVLVHSIKKSLSILAIDIIQNKKDIQNRLHTAKVRWYRDFPKREYILHCHWSYQDNVPPYVNTYICHLSNMQNNHFFGSTRYYSESAYFLEKKKLLVCITVGYTDFWAISADYGPSLESRLLKKKLAILEISFEDGSHKHLSVDSHRTPNPSLFHNFFIETMTENSSKVLMMRTKIQLLCLCYNRNTISSVNTIGQNKPWNGCREKYVCYIVLEFLLIIKQAK